jgi:argonaute-like protein implicated in RNA metabolism and viral defense
LAIYVKSMRTPWVLESLDADSAFVGLGMSLDRKAHRGGHVILGCSHLYNAQGQGLQFRLSKIENPIIRRKNAFMSFDDARRVGETIRQLFWESRFRLPRRVVIHKLTPFLDDERKGLQAGLSGVNELELLEINVDNALRYLSSVPQRDGSFKEDKFPMKRGTLLKLDSESALLWVHGVSNAVDSRLKYYQGKRRIPAPLVIKRHVGRSDLTTIGEEILGLSKMNWNSFDLYTKMPATIESSRQIAKIGSLLERFGSTSYDYRLFM